MTTKTKREPSWLVRKWKSEPLLSTGMALLVLALLQIGVLIWKQGPSSMAEFMPQWTGNWRNILVNNASVGMIALGMTFVIILGGIDLAVGSTLVGVGTLVMVMIDTGPNGVLGRIGIAGIPAYIIAIIAGLLLGIVLGAINGIFVTRGNVPPFIATLGAMKIIRSVTQHFMQTHTPAVPKDFLNIANLRVGGQIILPAVYWLIMAVVMHVISRHTAFGRHVFAVGSNERTTRLSGINVNWVKQRVYALMGLIVGIAAVIQASRMGSMNPENAGLGYELDAIAAVIVGGTSMAGGRGSIVGTVIGMLIIGVMNNLLNLVGVPPFLREAFKGAIVIFAVLLQRKQADN